MCGADVTLENVYVSVCIQVIGVSVCVCLSVRQHACLFLDNGLGIDVHNMHFRLPVFLVLTRLIYLYARTHLPSGGQKWPTPESTEVFCTPVLKS